MDKRRQPPLRTGGRAWGPQRVALGLSLDRLSALSGVHKAILSQVENGRIIPSAEEYQRVTAALSTYIEGEVA